MASQYVTAARLARRGIPIAIELYRRWQQLTPEQRERYLRMAREYADRGATAIKEAQKRRPRRSN